jgi:hypothetical protein
LGRNKSKLLKKIKKFEYKILEMILNKTKIITIMRRTLLALEKYWTYVCVVGFLGI